MKSGKRLAIVLSIVILGSAFAFSQQPRNHEERAERYRSMKIAYFTDNLELTPEEAEKFWPVYNSHEKKREELMSQRRTQSKEFRQNMDELTDKEAEALVDEHIEIRKKEVALEEEFHIELKKILSPKKVMKVYLTEVRFREYMLRRIRDERGGGQGKQRNRYQPAS